MILSINNYPFVMRIEGEEYAKRGPFSLRVKSLTLTATVPHSPTLSYRPLSHIVNYIFAS